MKIMKKCLVLIFSSALLFSCKSLWHNHPLSDCSTVFEKNQDENFASAKCKILPIKIDENLNCEISGSDSVDNLLKIYSENKDRKKSILIVPIKALEDSDLFSWKNQIIYFFVKMKIKKHLSSDLFAELKDYEYKGLRCKIGGRNVVAWISDEKVVASFAK